jgi:membrane protein DedA with SNARE-associated domain
LQDWFVATVRTLGEPGVGLLMLLENVFPPIPSELIMPLAGYLAERGHMSFTLAVVAGATGSYLGAVGWYLVGRSLGANRIRRWAGRRGRYFGVQPRDVDRAQHWFDRHGPGTVLVGRLIPGLRALISVPAGVARMPLVTFLTFTAVGTAAWSAALAWLGRMLGSRFELVDRWIGPVSWVVVGGALAWYVVRLVRINRS